MMRAAVLSTPSLTLPPATRSADQVPGYVPERPAVGGLFGYLRAPAGEPLTGQEAPGTGWLPWAVGAGIVATGAVLGGLGGALVALGAVALLGNLGAALVLAGWLLAGWWGLAAGVVLGLLAAWWLS